MRSGILRLATLAALASAPGPAHLVGATRATKESSELAPVARGQSMGPLELNRLASRNRRSRQGKRGKRGRR